MSKDMPTSFRYTLVGARKRYQLGWLFRLNRLLWGEAAALALASNDEWLLVQRVYADRERHARIKARVMGAIERMAQDGPPAEQEGRDG